MWKVGQEAGKLKVQSSKFKAQGKFKAQSSKFKVQGEFKAQGEFKVQGKFKAQGKLKAQGEFKVQGEFKAQSSKFKAQGKFQDPRGQLRAHHGRPAWRSARPVHGREASRLTREASLTVAGGGAGGAGSRHLASRRDALARARTPSGVSLANSLDSRLRSGTPRAWARVPYPGSREASCSLRTCSAAMHHRFREFVFSAPAMPNWQGAAGVDGGAVCGASEGASTARYLSWVRAVFSMLSQVNQPVPASWFFQRKS